MSNNYLLTGATGFVGKQLLLNLLAKGETVTVIVREGKQSALPAHSGISKIIMTKDLFTESDSWWADACSNIHTFIHAAWYAVPGSYLQSSENIDCLIGTLHAAKCAALSGVKRFVGLGTCFEYDLEHGDLACDSPLNPQTPYAATKAATYMALSEYFKSKAIEFAWCRLFYLYGEGEDMRRLVPYVKSHLVQGLKVELTTGNQVRDYLDVRIASEMLVQVAQSHESGVFNICSGQPVTVRQFVEKIADEYGRRDLLDFGARPDNTFEPPRVVGILRKIS